MGSWKRSGSVDGHGDGSLKAFWVDTDWGVLKQSWDGVWNIEYLLGIYTDRKEREEAGFCGRKIQTTMSAWQQSLNQPQGELCCLYATTTPIHPKQTLDLSFLWRGVLLLLRAFAGTDCRIHLLTVVLPAVGVAALSLKGNVGDTSLCLSLQRQVKLVLESEEWQWNEGWGSAGLKDRGMKLSRRVKDQWM